MALRLGEAATRLGLLAVVMLVGCGSPAPVGGTPGLTHQYAVDDPQFLRSMGLLNGPSMQPGNSVQTLIDAPQFYPAMLEAIAAAEKTITLESFTFDSDATGQQFVEALAERARAGVQVHILIDSVGSVFSAIDERTLRDAGAAVVRYKPPEGIVLLLPALSLNHRTHRKLLVIDGQIAFTGGAGFSERWSGSKTHEPWRDNHYRIEGPLVTQCQAAFVGNWLKATGVLLDGEAYFPAQPEQGAMFGQVFVSSPENGGRAAMELMILLSVYAAAESIDIGAAYFVPTALLTEALLAARQRGVAVRIVIPGPINDSEVVRRASHAAWPKLLGAGVEIYEYQPAVYHVKLVVVDGLWSIIGSANLDPRSFRLNDEASVGIYDRQFARQQIELLEEDMVHSIRIDEARHNRRSLLDRIQEFFASFIGSQL